LDELSARYAPAAYAPPSVLASFPASSILAQAAGSGRGSNVSSRSSGTDILPYVIGGAAGIGLGFEYL
jgi:hypothetical protein